MEEHQEPKKKKFSLGKAIFKLLTLGGALVVLYKIMNKDKKDK